jgi:ligand-binding sensor domain-containing protein
MLEFRKDGGVQRYNMTNSTLHSLNVDTGKINVGGVAFDGDGNLWTVACGNTRAISTRKADGTWQDFIIPETTVSGYSLYDMVVDDYGQKWFCARNSSTGEGVCVFKEENLNNPFNAKFRRLTDDVGNGALPDMYVRSLAKDKDGSIWIGTNKGVAVIYNPGNVFTAGGFFDAQKIIIQQDGYNQYLLETEFVNSIAVDGANRKWFGTYSGGAFLMSADGTKQIRNFNTENSPLPSNYVSSIAIDDVSGEVFFATEKGIISYRGDATEGGEKCSDYYVFPNPVRSEYKGPIAVRGLVANADVKIADVAGNVVFHTKANGGEAIWNGNNFKGERAKTGVYIVYVSNEDGSQTCTTKMLIGN